MLVLEFRFQDLQEPSGTHADLTTEYAKFTGGEGDPGSDLIRRVVRWSTKRIEYHFPEASERFIAPTWTDLNTLLGQNVNLLGGTDLYARIPAADETDAVPNTFPNFEYEADPDGNPGVFTNHNWDDYRPSLETSKVLTQQSGGTDIVVKLSTYGPVDQSFFADITSWATTNSYTILVQREFQTLSEDPQWIL